MKLILIFTSLLYNILKVYSDIPVNCMRSQIYGKWKFNLSNPVPKSIPELYAHTCGHQLPSHESTSHKTLPVNTQDFPTEMLIELNENGSAHKGELVGQWTMVYNEGFDINFSNKEDSYFIFSRYDENKHQGDNHIKDRWLSYCNETLVGWYHTAKGWGCFYGAKEGAQIGVPTNGEVKDKQFVTEKNKVVNSYSFLGAEATMQLTASFKDHAALVEKINSMGLTWTAKNYEQFQDMTMKDLNGMYRKGSSTSENKQLLIPHEKELRSVRNSLFKKPVYNCTELPKNHTYTEYMGKPRSQVSLYLIYRVVVAHVMRLLRLTH
jgi:cathepsin C